MGFVMVMDPAAIAAAPHTWLATIYADTEAEGRLLRSLGGEFPNITIISVKDVIERVSGLLTAIGRAVIYGALATLLTGAFVLIGTAAMTERARVFEAAVLKTLGARRSAILRNFAYRSLILGAVAGGVAILAGGIAGWAVMTQVMEASFVFEPVSATIVVLAGIFINTIAGLIFAITPLGARPARVLRARD